MAIDWFREGLYTLLELENPTDEELLYEVAVLKDDTIWRPISEFPEEYKKNGTVVLLKYWKSGGWRSPERNLFVVTAGKWQERNWSGTAWWVDMLGRMIQDTGAKKSISTVTHFCSLTKLLEKEK